MSTPAEGTTEIPPSNAADIPTSISRAITPVMEPRDVNDSSAVAESNTVGKDMASVVFHADWNIVINVEGKSGTIQFKGVSCNIAATSKVWRKIIYGDTAKPCPDSKEYLVVDLEDDAKALETLLRIIHYDFSKVPKRTSLDELFQMTRLTSKYQCAHLTYPWASMWIRPLATYIRDNNCAKGNHKAAWIAWELGAVKILRSMVDSIIVTSKVDSDGELVNEAGVKLRDLVLPSGFLDRIVAVRVETIEKILSKVQAPIDHLSKRHQQDTRIRYCKIGSDSEKCENMMFGSVVRQLIQTGLFPFPAATKYEGSIRSLKDQLFTIECDHWEGKDYVPHKSHRGCDLGQKDSLLKVLEKMSFPLERADVAHLARQSAMSGIDNGTDLIAMQSTLRATAAEFSMNGKVETEQSTCNVKIENVDDKDIGDTTNEDTTQESDGNAKIKEEEVDEE